MTAILLVAGAGGLLAFNLPWRGPASDRLAGSDARSSQLAAESAARTAAVNWILQQVSQSAFVSCDPAICTELANRGFPNTSTLENTSTDPLASTLVVATYAIRAQFAGRLASVYAPVTIASFGSGNARIDILWVYPGGTAKYRSVQKADQRARKEADAQLLANGQIRVSPAAKAQLLSGDIDPRLADLLAIMAHYHAVSIVDFVNQSPGGGPASLLRSVDLATVDPTAHLTRAAYLHWMQAFSNAQTAQYLPTWVQPVTLHTGQPVLRIGYGAPSPLS